MPNRGYARLRSKRPAGAAGRGAQTQARHSRASRCKTCARRTCSRTRRACARFCAACAEYVGTRRTDAVVYPESELAQRHRAGVSRRTRSPANAYADVADDVDTPYREGWLPDL